MKKRHITQLSQGLPAYAASPVEIDGMFQKGGRMLTVITTLFSTATAGRTFWNLITGSDSGA